MRKKIEISFDPAGLMGDIRGCYRACLADFRGVKGAGKTPAEAVGDMFTAHPEYFGKKVEHGWERTPAANQAATTIDAFVPEGKIALGSMVLQVPDVFNVEITMMRSHLWPKSEKKASVYDLV